MPGPLSASQLPRAWYSLNGSGEMRSPAQSAHGHGRRRGGNYCGYKVSSILAGELPPDPTS
ncbi:MAG: hypothetical protein KTR33_07330 [Gammaproteobacteria bacterium]|nr:hypothetical protein [Gammaproteobacteria bacterium]